MKTLNHTLTSFTARQYEKGATRTNDQIRKYDFTKLSSLETLQLFRNWLNGSATARTVEQLYEMYEIDPEFQGNTFDEYLKNWAIIDLGIMPNEFYYPAGRHAWTEFITLTNLGTGVN